MASIFSHLIASKLKGEAFQFLDSHNPFFSCQSILFPSESSWGHTLESLSQPSAQAAETEEKIS